MDAYANRIDAAVASGMESMMTNCGSGVPVVDPGAALRRTFDDAFTAEQVAEPLVSFDFDRPAEAVAMLMSARDFDVAGVRFGGVVGGWVQRQELDEGQLDDHVHDIGPDDLVSASLPFTELVPRLADREFLFVSSLGAVGGIVTRADLQKAPLRMWLFGVLTLLESQLAREIRVRFPNGGWRELLSEKRITRAEALQAERRRRNEHLELLDCLSFGDKGWILSKVPEVLDRLEIPSRRVARERIKGLEQLRNRLAHGHDVVAADLPVMARLATRLELLLEAAAEG
jgi:hypothetical protein